MKAFIANCTNQHQIMNVRLPDMKGPMTVPIEAGRQVQFPKELSMKEMESLTGQMRKYGMVTVEEALGHKPGTPIVYIVNAEKVVPERVMRDAFDVNRGVLTDRGRDMRRVAALAARKNMIDQAHTPLAADSLELSLEEQPGRGQTNVDGLLAEGIRIQTSAAATAGGGRSRRANRRK